MSHCNFQVIRHARGQAQPVWVLRLDPEQFSLQSRKLRVGRAGQRRETEGGYQAGDAQDQFGFEADNVPLMIEAIPITEGDRLSAWFTLPLIPLFVVCLPILIQALASGRLCGHAH